MNLAYYKDVAFCFSVVAEFCGMFYFANITAFSGDRNDNLSSERTWIAAMIAINLTCGVATLIIHSDSAFYTK
jgi:hypothetical protein